MEEDYISEGLNNFISYNYSYSLQMFNKADSINKSNADIKFYLGVCHLKLGDYINSIKELNLSQECGNKSFELFLNRGTSHLYNGDMNYARQDFLDAINVANESQRNIAEKYLQKIN